MSLGLVSLTLSRTCWNRAPIVVPALAAARLCREDGYVSLPAWQAVALIDEVVPHKATEVRQFLASARLGRLALSQLDTTELRDLLRTAIRAGALAVVCQGDGSRGGPSDAAVEERRLVRAIEGKRRQLSQGGRVYKLVPGGDFARFPARDSYEVVARVDAVAVLDRMAAEAGGDLASLLTRAREGLSPDWRPPLSANGLVLLRRIPTLTAANSTDEPAVTPSQLKQLVKHWIEIEAVDQEGEPYTGRFQLGLPSGTAIEGTLDAEGFYGNYAIDPGTCKLSFLFGKELPGAPESELPAVEPEVAPAKTEAPEPPTAPAVDLPTLAPPTFPARDVVPPLASCSVTVVDGAGRKLAGVMLRFSQGSDGVEVATDGSGVATFQAHAARIEVSFASAEQVAGVVLPLWESDNAAPSGAPSSGDALDVVVRPTSIETADGSELPPLTMSPGESKTLSLRPGKRRATLVELHDTLFRTDSAVVNPEGEAPSNTAGSHAALTTVGLIATILRYNEEHPGRKLFIAGHADRAGTEAANVTLSEHRAKAVLALLEGQRQDYVAACKAKHSEVDVTQLFDWTHRNPSFNFKCKPTTLTAAPSDQNYYLFRTSYNEWVKGAAAANEARGTSIGATGRLQDDIWAAMFDLYEHALKEELGEDGDGLAALRGKIQWVDAGIKTIGYGEAYPTKGNTPDGTRSQADRRVEVMLFPSGEEPNLAATHGDEIYDPSTFERTVVEPLVSAKRWTASWDKDGTPATMGETRRLELDAPGLPAGMPAEFTLTRECGKQTTTLEFDPLTSGDGSALCIFGDWDAELPPKTECNLALTELPPCEFHFTVKCGGRVVRSGVLPYADVVKVAFKDQEGADPLRKVDCRVLTPWGFIARTTDDDGILQEEKAPPGGARVVLIDYQLVSSHT